MTPLSPAAWPAIDTSFIEQQTATQSFQLGKPSAIWVAPDGATVLFTRSGPRSVESDLHALSVATGATTLVVAARDLLAEGPEELSTEEQARRERMRQTTRGITSFSASEDGARLCIPLSGRLFLHERGSGRTRELAVDHPALDPLISPDGRSIAYVHDGDLHVLDLQRGAVERLTRRSSTAISHGVAEFVAQEEMDRMRGAWWSPDGRHLAVQRTDESAVETLHVADATRPEVAPVAFRYPRAGTANAEVTLGIMPAGGGPTVWVDWDRARHPYLATVTWPRRGPLTIVVQNRQQTEELVLAVDAATGATRLLLREEDAAWINLDQTMPLWLDDGSGFLWSTERDGAWQLELRGADGALVRTLTGPELGYLSCGGLARERGAIWVRATGGDPLGSDLYRVPLDGSPAERVTRGGENTVVGAAGTGVHVVVTTGRDGASRWSVAGADDAELGLLPSVAEAPSITPSVEHVIVPCGGRTHHAAIVRPRALEQGKRYSVLLSVYGGPHHNQVVGDATAYLLDQWYADAGFVVVRIDGRGTPRRGRAWERAIRGDLTGAPLDDQIAVLRELAGSRPEMDLDQVGVFGWSFGGTLSAMAALQRPDVFRAAVAGAPVTDWRDYDTHYTERYMGLPADNQAGYDATSAIALAPRLQRPLLLIHGTTDDNVYFTHSLKLAQALFRAGRPFDMLPLAGFTHMVPDPTVKKALVGRIVEFFRRHLEAPRPRTAPP